jgi:plastocyanin
MRRLALFGAVAVALVAAGCGGGGSSSSSTSSGGAGTGSAAPSMQPAAKPGQVGMKNIKFAPDKTTVKVGEKVTWTNDDSVDHNVTATKGASFKSGNFGKGGTFTFTPKKAGTIQYTCTIHPGMNGTLTVSK